MKHLSVNIILLILILTCCATAQESDEQKIAEQPDTLIFSDTTLLSGTALVTDTLNFEEHLTQQPTKALFKSMFVPGWGQFGNKKYIKGFCFLAFDAWMIYRAVNYRNSARDYWDKYENAATISEKNAYYDLYSDQKDDRNKFTWYAVITSFFAMFDAYVDAHLSGYPAQQDKNRFSFDIENSEEYDTKVRLMLSF